MSNPNRVLGAKIGHLRKKIKESPGELGIIVRDFSRPGHSPPHVEYSHIIQMGTLTGESELISPFGSFNSMKPWLSPSHHGGHGYDWHSYTKDLIIPCERFIERRTGSFLPGFHLNLEDIENIAPGDLSIGINELRKFYDLHTGLEKFYDTNISKAFNDIRLAIGDQATGDLLEKMRIHNPEELVRLFKDPAYATQKVDKNYAQIASVNAKNLVELLNNIAPDLSKLQDKEERLLNITGDYWKDQGSTDFRYGSDYDYEQLGIYEEMRSRLISQIKKAQTLMGERLPEVIESTSPGFPTSTETKEYLAIIEEKVIGPTRQLIRKVDKHLKDVRDEAHRRAFPDRYK